MSKIKFELDLSDVFAWDGESDEYGNPSGENFNSWVEGEINNQIKTALSSKIDDAVSKKIDEIMTEQTTYINEKIGIKLNEFMDEFFTTPYDIKDRYGDIQHKDICVKTLLKEACDNFVNQEVDKNGNPITSRYDKGTSRITYMVNKSWEQQLKFNVDKMTTEAVNEIQKKIKEETSKQLGEKLSKLVGLDNMLR